jgi:membrane dipeptidase
MLGNQLSRIESFWNLGVRIMQLSYNDRSLYGDGCLERQMAA